MSEHKPAVGTPSADLDCGELSVGQIVDLLGGAEAAEVFPGDGRRARREAFENVRGNLVETYQTIGPITGLCARLDLLAAIISLVRESHARDGGPLLNLTDRWLRAEYGQGAVPRVRLEPGHTPRRIDGKLNPPEDLDPLFLDSAFEEIPVGQRIPVDVEIDSVSPMGGNAVVQGTATAEAHLSAYVADKDPLRIWFAGPDGTEIEVACTPGILRRAPKRSRELAFVGILEETAPDLLEWLGSTQRTEGQLAFYRDHQPGSDIHSLGILIFRMLLGNADQSLQALNDSLIRPITVALRRTIRRKPAWGDEDFRDRVTELLQDETLKRLSSIRNLWYHPQDHTDTFWISPEIWFDILALGFRAVAWQTSVETGEPDAKGDVGSTLEGMLEVLSTHRERLTPQLDPARMFGDLSSHISRIQEENLSLRAELGSVKRLHKKLASEREKLRQTKATLEGELQLLEQDRSELQQKSQRISDDLTELSERLQEASRHEGSLAVLVGQLDTAVAGEREDPESVPAYDKFGLRVILDVLLSGQRSMTSLVKAIQRWAESSVLAENPMDPQRFFRMILAESTGAGDKARELRARFREWLNRLESSTAEIVLQYPKLSHMYIRACAANVIKRLDTEVFDTEDPKKPQTPEAIFRKYRERGKEIAVEAARSATVQLAKQLDKNVRERFEALVNLRDRILGMLSRD